MSALTTTAPLAPVLPNAAGPACTLQRTGSLWQLGIEAQELTTAIGLLAQRLESDEPEDRQQAITELEAALLADEGNRQALAAKADATCWVIEHLRDQAAYRQQQAKRLTELSRSDAGRADALEESLVLVLTRLQPAATRFSFPNHELRNTRSTAVAIENEALLDPEWLAVKTTFQADKAAIKAALKAGQEIAGAQLISRRSSGSALRFLPRAGCRPLRLPRSGQCPPAGAGPQPRELPGRQVIAEANRIFGFDGWQRQTIAVRCVAQAERNIGRDQKPGWGVTYTARVRVTVTAGGLPPLVREGSGAGHGIDVDLGQAHESALKEAETDAMKRAMITFGNPFGLALYDKAQRQVSSAAGQGDGAQRPGGQRPPVSRPPADAPAAARTSPAHGRTQAAASTAQQSAPADPGQQSLNADTIRHLHTSLRALPRPQLESLTRAFRKRFQVPEEAVTIADRINQKCHHDWIEAFLVQQ